MSNKELQEEHQEVQASRRALELELHNLPANLESAIQQANVAEIQRLNKRKRELPEELQTASALEHAAYGKFCRAEMDRELQLTETAQTKVDQAETELSRRHAEWVTAQTELSRVLERAQIERNGHQREVETWQARFNEADARFRAAVAEQQAA